MNLQLKIVIKRPRIGVWLNQGTNARKIIAEVYAFFCTAEYCLWAEK